MKQYLEMSYSATLLIEQIIISTQKKNLKKIQNLIYKLENRSGIKITFD